MPDPVETDTTVIHIGCSDLPSGLARSRYFGGLGYLEVSTTMLGLPRVSVLHRWRQDAGEAGQLGLVAPQLITHRPGPRGYPRWPEALTAAELAQAGGFRATDVVRRTTEALATAVIEAGAGTVVFRSASDFAPSATNRDAMRAFFDDIAPAERFGNAVRVWEPQGLWELESAARFASELGVVLACDPLTQDPLVEDPDIFMHLPGGAAYFRITGLGSGRSRFDDYALETLAAMVEGYERTWIVFANPGKYPDALRFRRMLETGETA